MKGLALKLRVLQINAVPYGSTGGIMFSLADVLEAKGDHVLCTTGFSWRKCERSDYFMTSNILEKTIHTYLARITGRIGCFSYLATLNMIRKISEFNPDIIHLHNLHGWFVNIPMLFKYIKETNTPVIWTFHDCWPFTGHCPHFTMINCDKWKTGCYDCPQHLSYPKSYFDCSKLMYSKKAIWFSDVKNLTIVTPSQWLSNLVKLSFLKDYSVKVINNGIDLNIFHPIKSDFRKNNELEEKHIVLGVAYAWDNRKGLDVFIELSKRLDNNYKIVLVGTDDEADKLLPKNIISIHRTKNQKELAEIYSAADVFVNPTREDNYPTVNMEALACGTPVVTYKTGGSGEIPDKKCGTVVPYNDSEALISEVKRVCLQKPYSEKACLERAKSFDMNNCFQEYEQLYRCVYERVTKS